MKAHVVLTALLVITAAVRADNWPAWRGPENTGVSRETGIVAEWGDDKNILWKFPMPGRGGATPVVWGERIFLTSGEGNDQALLCMSVEGKLLWKRVVGSGGRVAIKGDEANEASASPSTDGKHVWAFVGSGHLGCYDVDGREVWNVDIQKRYGKFDIQHGLHTTPVVHDDCIYLSLLHSGGHWVVALDKLTGAEKWKAARKTDAIKESKEAYASPCLWNDGKETQLVVLGADYATGHRLKDGAEIWRLVDLNPKSAYHSAFRIIASPVASKDVLVVPTCRGLAIAALKPGATARADDAFPQQLALHAHAQKRLVVALRRWLSCQPESRLYQMYGAGKEKTAGQAAATRPRMPNVAEVTMGIARRRRLPAFGDGDAGRCIVRYTTYADGDGIDARRLPAFGDGDAGRCIVRYTTYADGPEAPLPPYGDRTTVFRTEGPGLSAQAKASKRPVRPVPPHDEALPDHNSPNGDAYTSLPATPRNAPDANSSAMCDGPLP